MNTEEPMEDWRAEAMIMKEMLKFGKVTCVVDESERLGENFSSFTLHVTNTHRSGVIFCIEGLGTNVMVQDTLSKYWTPMGQYSVVRCTLVTHDPVKSVAKVDLEGKPFRLWDLYTEE